MLNDPISDMLTRIHNSLTRKKSEVILPHSKLKYSLATLLWKKGWLEDVQVLEEDKRKFLKLGLKYTSSGSPAISGLKRISKPGQRIYAKVADFPRLKLGVGAIIISTSKGLMTNQEARKQKMGGEVVCRVW